MADEKVIEREYVIPLRRFWFRVATYERTSRAIKAIKEFVAKHMKVEDRDVDNVKLDVYFNNEMWFRGRANPPAKIKVKVRKENGIVTVNFVEDPKRVAFTKAKHARIHRATDTKTPLPSATEKLDHGKTEVKSEEAKADEKEKEAAVAEANQKDMKQQAHADKHTNQKPEKATHPKRMALQK